MSYVCYDCQIIFPSKRTNCPFCGGRIYSDEKSASALQNEGFTLSDIKAKPGNTADSSDTFHIDDSDILAALRQSYDRQHRRAGRSDDTVQTKSSQNSTAQPTPRGSVHTMPQTEKKSAEANRSDDDFFSQFQTSAASAADIPTVESPSGDSAPFTPLMDDDMESELRSIERQRRRIRNNYRRLAVLDFFRSINWRIVFRIIVIAVAILGLLAIWKMRYVILDSVLSLVAALIPVMIILWIIVRIFRSFFK